MEKTETDQLVKASLDEESDRQIQAYKSKLKNALDSKKLPPSLSAIEDDSKYRDSLSQYIKDHNIGHELKEQVLRDFDDKVVKANSDFAIPYSTAMAEFKVYLDSHIPHAIRASRKDFVKLADKTTIDSSLSKPRYKSLLDQYKAQVVATFVDDIGPLGLSQDPGPYSIQLYTEQLSDKIRTEERFRLTSLDMKIAKYNRTLLNDITHDVLVGVADYDITTVTQLKTDIDKAKDEFYSRAHGELDDKNSAWQIFKDKTADLIQSIRRCEGTTWIKGTDTTKLATCENTVLDAVYKNVAGLANYLGMSWIDDDVPFSRNRTQSKDSGGDWKFRNTGSYSGYDTSHATNMQLNGWKAEFSDFVFDPPIIRELKPASVDTITPSPSEDAPVIVNVNISRTEESTVSNTQSLTIELTREIGATVNIGEIASAEVKDTFRVSGEMSITSSNTTTYGISVDVPVACPPDVSTTINCIVFDQLATITYTATIRLIPQCTFYGGFTRYGTDGVTRNYLRGHYHDRYYGDIKNGYLTDLKDLASQDADPWEWKTFMEDYKEAADWYLSRLCDRTKYEFKIRGKWDGITGRYHVIETDIGKFDE